MGIKKIRAPNDNYGKAKCNPEIAHFTSRSMLATDCFQTKNEILKMCEYWDLWKTRRK